MTTVCESKVTMVYEWKTIHYPVDAQEAGEYLDALSREMIITPSSIVSKARDSANILHPCFEWADDIAAERYREQQARVLLGNLTVVKVNDEDKPPVRAFVHYAKADGGRESAHYVPTYQAMADDETRDYVLKTAMRELESFKRKYSNLKELSKVITAIDRLLAV